MTDIFISYASEDRDRAERLARAFEARSWTVWWDRKVMTGQAYDQLIERALGGARCVVVLWSQTSVSSEWVKNEAAVAMERNVLLPAAIDAVAPPLEFRRRQTADLSDWDGSRSHPGFEALCTAISSAPGSAAPRVLQAPRPLATRVSGRVPRISLAAIALVALVGGAYYVGLHSGRSRPASEMPPASGRSAPSGDADAAPAVVTSPRSAEPTLNLLAAENGGRLLMAPSDAWAASVDGREDAFREVRVGESGVFGFNGQRAATFDTFGLLIPQSGRTPKEVELFAGDESPTGSFRPIDTLHPQNAKIFEEDGWQYFSFQPVTARYLRVRLKSSYEKSVVWIAVFEFRLMNRSAAR